MKNLRKREEKGSEENSGNGMKEYVVTGLLRLMRKKPYEEIKVTDIVREAGVSRMTYYRYFKSKSDVLVSLIDYIIRSVNPICHEERCNGDWRRFWLALFSYADKYASALGTIVAAGQGRLILECLNRSAFPHLEKEETAENFYRRRFLAGALYNVFIEWLSSPKRESPERMADILCAFTADLIGDA